MNLKIKKLIKQLNDPTVLFGIFLALMMSYAWVRSSGWYKKSFDNSQSGLLPIKVPQK